MNKYIFLSIYLACSLFTEIALSQSQQGSRVALPQKDFTEAFTGFLKRAENGDPEAQARVASMYALGQGVDKDEAAGHSWAKKAAEQGNANGEFFLGLNYSRGRGVTKDEPLGAFWYRKAIEKGHIPAMGNLGNMYKGGLGIPQDFQKAIELFNAIIKKNSRYPLSYMSLSEMYSNGQGLPENQIEALRLANLGVSYMDATSPAYDQAQKQINKIKQKIADSEKSIQTASPSSPVLQANQTTVVIKSLSVQDPRKDCEGKIALDNRLSVLSAKIPLISPFEIGFAMLADQSYPNQDEQKAIALFADGIRKCTKEADSFRQQNYSKEMNAVHSRFDSGFMEAAIELYSKKLTYAKFNAKLETLDKELSDGLGKITNQVNAQKNQQEEANKARAEAMRDAQRRQDQARSEEAQQQQQQRQAEQDRLLANRNRWAARCNLDKTNAYEQAKVKYKNECDSTYANASNTPINRIGVVACALAIENKSEQYAKITYDACMSGTP
jgi:hypothetical protein